MVSLVPWLPVFFCSSVLCSVEERQKWEGLGTWGVGGATTDSCAINLRASILTVKLSTLNLMNVCSPTLYLEIEHSLMKSSMLHVFEYGPNYVHLNCVLLTLFV